MNSFWKTLQNVHNVNIPVVVGYQHESIGDMLEMNLLEFAVLAGNGKIAVDALSMQG